MKEQNKIIDNILMISPAYIESLNPTLSLCDKLITTDEPPFSRVRKTMKALAMYQNIPLTKRKINEDYTNHLIRVINWGWKYRCKNSNVTDTNLIDNIGAGLVISDGIVNFQHQLWLDVQDKCLSVEQYQEILKCLADNCTSLSSSSKGKVKRYI